MIVKDNNDTYSVQWLYPRIRFITEGESISRRIGTTLCYIKIYSTETIIGTGNSLCKGNDNFSKEIGRKLSLKSALKDGNFPKDIRKTFWNTYLNRKPIKKDINERNT